MNRVKVNIGGNDYVLASEQTEDFIIKVAEFVNKEIASVSNILENSSRQDVLILACSNIAEKYLSDYMSKEDLTKKLQSQDKILESLKLANEQKDEKIKQIEDASKNDKLNHSKEINNSEEYQNLINEKEKQLEEYKNINNDLQAKFYDLQIKLVKQEEEIKKLKKNGDKIEQQKK